MRRLLSSLHQHVTRLRVAYLVLILSLFPTALVYYRVGENVAARDRARFDRATREEQAALELRIPRYVDKMLGLRGLFAVSPTVSADQWQKYLAATEMPKLYPGIRVLGYAERVEMDQRQDYLKRLRARVADAVIDPPGDRPVYFPHTYLTSFTPDLHVVPGTDPFADPEKRRFMEAARDTGQPVASGKFVFTNQTGLTVPGFIIYLPVYRGGITPETVEQRRTALQGFITAKFDTDRLLGGLSLESDRPAIDLEVFDGPEMTAEHLLHDRDHALHPAQSMPYQLATRTTLPVLNQIWTIYFRSLPAFEAEARHHFPLVALAAWLALSFILFGITVAQVNARTRAETVTAALRESEAALAAETQRLAVTLYSIGDGVITTDKTGAVLSLNQAAEQLTGWPQDEARGEPVAHVFKVIHEGTREPCANLAAIVLATGAGGSLGQPAILVARDATERLIADSAAPIHDQTGAVIGAVVVFRDITAKQKSEAEVLKESKLESVGLLAGGIAHDFNNILQGILGNLSLARMNAHSTEKMLERLAGVEKAALRAKDLTQQLVMFARGGAPIRKQLQLANILKDATLFALSGTNVNCEFSLPADLCPAEVDEGQFRQVIHNIVLNAVQAMPEGGKIEVRAENVELTTGYLPPLNAGKYLKISVRDFGSGIRPEDLPKIFDPYFSTRKQSRGLGLASARSVIRKHDGQITVESQPGRGSTFHLYLPASLQTAPATLSDTEQQRLFGKGRVLIMDDEADILELGGVMLRTMGYEVEVAKEGGEALQLYEAARKAGQPFAVVIMDLTVPEGMGGKECIRRLKELDPRARAIVSSGYSMDPVMASYQEFGFNGVIPKPYDVQQLGRVVAEVLGKKTAAAPAPS